MNERGTAIVDFAVAAPVCLLLLFAVFGFGSALYTYTVVANAAPLGARYAIVRGAECTQTGCPATSSTVETYVQGKSPGVTTNNMTVSTSWANTTICPSSKYPSPNNNYPGCTVTVSVSYPFTLNLPIFRSLAGWTMSSTSTMVISQ